MHTNIEIIRKYRKLLRKKKRLNSLLFSYLHCDSKLVELYKNAYITTIGSLYMATLGFLALGLPADDYFWTNSFEEWTSCKIWSGKPSRKDYKVEY